MFILIIIAGKDGGKAKPLKKPKTNKPDYDEDDKEFLKKKKVSNHENPLACSKK